MEKYPIDEKYYTFCLELNKNKINWCFIKDFEFLLKEKYDNEIDITALKKDRNKIRKIATKIGWRESSHNTINSHLIFWKYTKDKVYRVDIHLDKVLACAAPIIHTRNILKKKEDKYQLFYVNKEYELAILFLTLARGRNEIKKYRTKRILELKKYKEKSYNLLPKKIQKKYLENFENMSKGIKFRVSENIRLSKVDFIKQEIIKVLLLINRIIKPSPHIYIKNKVGKNKLEKIITLSKQNIKIITLNKKKEIYYPWNFYKKYFCDFLLIKGVKKSYEIKNEYLFFKFLYDKYYNNKK